MRPCSPRSLLEEVAELFAARAESKGVELLCHVHPDVPPCIEVDGDRVRQIVNNLVGNAIKFTDQGEVVVRASAARLDGDECILELVVIDTGIGIDESEQALLFEAFSQVDGSSTRRFGGTGLGLAISKKLVTLMGGELSVTSQPGKGSQFFVHIPVRILAAESTRIPLRNHDTRALIVDDNATNRLLLEELLSSWGLRTASANGGAAALQLLADASDQDPFGLVITDMHMPEMDGLELARAIRDTHATLPLLMLTSLSDTGGALADRGLFSGVLSKPVRATDLESNIARALGDSSGLRLSIAPEYGGVLIAADQPRRILVAEDNPINQEVMIGVLDNLGYSADIVSNGRLAVEAWERSAYPVILMDCQMPIMDGYEAARQIRQHETPGLRVAIIAVTAHAMLSERDKATAAGMDDYVTKPLDTKLLKESLERWWPRTTLWPPAPSHAPSGPPRYTASQASSSIPAASVDANDGALDPGVSRSHGVVRVFLRHVPDQLASIASALESGDSEALSSAAHKLKGSCLSVGVPRMAALCANLEALEPEASSASRARELKAQLDHEFAHVRAQLNRLLPLKSA